MQVVFSTLQKRLLRVTPTDLTAAAIGHAMTTATASPTQESINAPLIAAQSPRPMEPVTTNDGPGKVVLAPMVRTGELPTRLVALEYGADLVWSPEIIDKAIIGCERIHNPSTDCVEFRKAHKVIFATHRTKERARVIFQMGTANADLAVQAAKVVAEDVYGIDVNAGCPKHFSIHAGMGAGLLSNIPNLVSILKALYTTYGRDTMYNLPISVKIRLLDDIPKTYDLTTQLCQTGITTLTLHCRTIPMRPRERAIRDALAGAADICRTHNVAFFVNGDIDSRDHAYQIIKEYNIHGGAMLAQAAQANCSVFTSGTPRPPLEVAHKLLQNAMAVDNHISNTKFCLTHIVPGKASEYTKLAQSKTYKEMCEVLGVECIISEENDQGTMKAQKKKQAHEHMLQQQAQAKNKKQEKTKAVQNAIGRNQSGKAAGGKFRREKEGRLSERGVNKQMTQSSNTSEREEKMEVPLVQAMEA